MKQVNLKAIEKNYNDIKALVNDKTIYAVLKSNAYGCGMLEIASLLIELGVSHFCVKDLNEALMLRQLDKRISILMLSDFSINELEIIRNEQITITISDIDKICFLKNHLVEIKINTGMNRFGIGIDQFYECLDLLSKQNCKLQGIYTHMAIYQGAYFYEQYLKFSSIAKSFNNINVHFASSKGLDLEMDLFNSVRVGMALYRDNSVMISKKIVKINKCSKNEYAGYCDYKMEKEGLVGIINMGYDDGLSRANKGRYVYIEKDYYKIIAICMNQSFILIDETICVGSKVEILGSKVTLDYLSTYLKTNPHEILTSFKNQTINYLA